MAERTRRFDSSKCRGASAPAPILRLPVTRPTELEPLGLRPGAAIKSGLVHIGGGRVPSQGSGLGGYEQRTSIIYHVNFGRRQVETGTVGLHICKFNVNAQVLLFRLTPKSRLQTICMSLTYIIIHVFISLLTTSQWLSARYVAICLKIGGRLG